MKGMTSSEQSVPCLSNGNGSGCHVYLGLPAHHHLLDDTHLTSIYSLNRLSLKKPLPLGWVPFAGLVPLAAAPGARGGQGGRVPLNLQDTRGVAGCVQQHASVTDRAAVVVASDNHCGLQPLH
jgi:hypothetical protein